MNFDFIPDQQSLYIPKEAYRPVKKCPFCQSVFLTDSKCETCGRLLNYDLIGTPFSYKSGYQIKERYIQSLPLFNRFYPSFEDKKSVEAKSLNRNLEKRLRDLCLGFSTPGMMKESDRKIFYIESKFIIDELIEYGVSFNFIEKIILDHLSDPNLLQDLIQNTRNSALNRLPDVKPFEAFLNYRFFGVLKIDFILKFSITMAVIIFTAIKFKSL